MHRDSQKRLYVPGATYFITTVTHGRYPYFAEGVLCRMMVDQIQFAQTMLDFSVHGCAIMPDHVHLLITPGDNHSYSRIMFSMKKQSSHNMNRLLGYNHVFPDDPGRNPGNDGPGPLHEGAQALARFLPEYPGRHFRDFDARLHAYRAEFA
ncbi:MAG TPA: transposase, partial [Spirochaetota bacterium]|nr:transposase [Spirochaetota bacterium]